MMNNPVNCWNSLRATTTTTRPVMASVMYEKRCRLANQQPSLLGIRGRSNEQRLISRTESIATKAGDVLPISSVNVHFPMKVDGCFFIKPDKNIAVLSVSNETFKTIRDRSVKSPFGVFENGGLNAVKYGWGAKKAETKPTDIPIAIKQPSNKMSFEKGVNFRVSKRMCLVWLYPMSGESLNKQRTTKPYRSTIPLRDKPCLCYLFLNGNITPKTSSYVLKNMDVFWSYFYEKLSLVFVDATVRCNEPQNISLFGGINDIKIIMLDSVTAAIFVNIWNTTALGSLNTVNYAPISNSASCNIITIANGIIRHNGAEGFQYSFGNNFIQTLFACGHLIKEYNICSLIVKTLRCALILLEKVRIQDKELVDNNKWIFSKKTVVKFYDKSVMPIMANTDYEGEIKAMGDKVIINTVPSVTVKSYKKGMTIDWENLESPNVELTMNRGAYTAFKFDKADLKQFAVKMMEKCSDDASEQLRVAIETEFLGDVYADVASANKGTTAGRKSSSYNVGTTGSAIALTKANIVDYIMMCEAIGDEQNWPDSDRYVTLPTWAKYLLNISDIKDASLTGSGKSHLVGGPYIGQIGKFKVLESNLYTAVSDGGSSCYNITFGHRSGITFAAQLTEMDFHDTFQYSFGKGMKGLKVYDWSVIKPESVGVLYAKKG